VPEPNERDALHLVWIHERLVNRHGESPNVDYMIRLREISERLMGRPINFYDRLLRTDHTPLIGRPVPPPIDSDSQ
jgi:hypothetical protein